VNLPEAAALEASALELVDSVNQVLRHSVVASLFGLSGMSCVWTSRLGQARHLG
jgi:hypothetical protein